MSDEWRSPGSREPRATDGLEWHAAPVDQPPQPEVPDERPEEPAPPAPRRNFAAWQLVGGAALVAGLLGGLAGGGIVALLDNTGNSGSPSASQATATPAAFTVQQTSAILDVASKSRPGVVRIESTHRTQTGTEQDIGSGVVLDTEGHILTNAHVVMDAETLKVILADGTQRPGIVIGTDYPFTDVAVVQISPGNLTPVPVGDSTRLSLGETVIAIGNPLAQFDGSVSVGVVSGLNRTRVFDAVRQDDLIQTDAAINNGNSGGALLNLQGQLVGIPTAVLRETPNGLPVEGIAFALPSSRAMTIAQRIITDGARYPRPSLDADTLDISPDLPPRLNRTAISDGAIVVAVLSGGAAASAGIVPGDVITKIGDEEVNQATPVLNTLLSHQPGDVVRVVLNRNGRIIETDVRLAKRA